MKFDQEIDKWKKFPEADELGYYHALGNYIYLNEYKNAEDFKKSASNPSLDRNRFSVFIHENQHYIDQVSTLWGLKNIFQIFFNTFN